jgi:UDP-N-acetylmuramoylalanine--D-glutamate ligase
VRYTDRKVAVLGAGLSGTAAAHLLKDEGAAVTVLDSAEERTILKTTIDGLRARGINVICGTDAERDAAHYELIVRSPGIDPASPLGRAFGARGVEMIGELELGWRSVSAPVVAITGTNGKTTTTELIAQMLNGCGQRTIACGNIGKPLSEVAREGRDLDVLTVEVSSFQLETITTFRPSVSVWLNFAPDHLDRYRSLAEYRAAKLRIFDYQTSDDIAVVNAAEELPPLKARPVTFSAYRDDADFRLYGGEIFCRGEGVLRLTDTRLRGSHNIENLMAAMAVGLARGLSFEQMVPPLCAYEPRPHRMEYVRTLGGVDYINDSKATNLDAVDKALRAQTKPVILIAGGKDKGFEYQPLTPLVREKVRATVLIGEMADRICRDWSESVQCHMAVSIADAVERAHALAQPGEVVLFSPGTSSFDMFKSYADRGDQFRALVRALHD